jgi:hypothetical protein
MKHPSLWIALVVALVGACDSDSGAGVLAPLSEDCAACLTASSDAEPNCGAAYGACQGDEVCSSAMVCELRARCYESAPGGSCASDGGCGIAGDAGVAEAARSQFEQCARTTCGTLCGFVSP